MRQIVLNGDVVTGVFYNTASDLSRGTVLDPSDTVELGWIQAADGTFSDPAVTPAIPTSISPRQARLQLLAEGNLDAINALIAASPQTYQIAWEFASMILRTDAVVQALEANSPYNTDAKMDVFFLSASKL
jgi:hypothetical protein